MTARVSVLTCTYERPRMLIECLASVAAQTRGDWEHIVTDDASGNPAVREILDDASARDSRIRTRWRPHVNRPAKHWNEMIDIARGDYFCFIDDDNLMLPNYVETMAGILDARIDVDVVTCGMILDDGRRFLKNLDTSTEIWQQNTIDNGCYMIRREAQERIGYYPECIRTVEDWAYMRRAASCLRMEHLSLCLTRYREHKDARSKTMEALGFAADEQWVRSQSWQASVGVRVSGSEDVEALVRSIPWVTEGDGMLIGVEPGVWRIGHRGEPWVVVSSEAEFAAHRRVVGNRVVAASLDGITRERIGRVVNAVRSPRYEAVIP